MRPTVLFFTFVYVLFSQPLLAQTHPPCLSESSDFDGDGWGWEFNRSCIVDETSTGSPICEDPDGDGYGWDGFGTCLAETANTTGNEAGCVDSDGDGYGWDGEQTCLIEATSAVTPQGGQSAATECIDPDGDGYGWDGTQTCLVNAASVQSETECVDPDGDGFGWDGTKTCLVESAPVVVAQAGTGPQSPEGSGVCVDPDGDGFGWNGTATCVTGLLSGVTDVVLMMGQSNALGEDTAVDPDGLDSVNNNIIAWTQFDGWQVADLCTQIWQKGWFPWRGGVCSNHPAFQIAKGIVAADPSRKVAIIPTGVAGKPISWWDRGALAYELAEEHTREALAALPGKNQVDLVAWSQGEANDGVEDEWYNKLTDMISRLRSESWFNSQETVFIAQETKDSSVNDTLPRFDSDGDDLTNWVRASDLSTKDGVHWSASALRTLGNRYAAKFLSVAD